MSESRTTYDRQGVDAHQPDDEYDRQTLKVPTSRMTSMIVICSVSLFGSAATIVQYRTLVKPAKTKPKPGKTVFAVTQFETSRIVMRQRDKIHADEHARQPAHWRENEPARHPARRGNFVLPWKF